MPSPLVADFMLISVCAPGEPAEPAGVLLLDHVSNRLFVSLKSLLTQKDSSIIEVWRLLAADLETKAAEWGGAAVLDWLEQTASHALQVSARERFEVSDISDALQQLYIEHIEPQKAASKSAS